MNTLSIHWRLLARAVYDLDQLMCRFLPPVPVMGCYIYTYATSRLPEVLLSNVRSLISQSLLQAVSFPAFHLVKAVTTSEARTTFISLHREVNKESPFEL